MLAMAERFRVLSPARPALYTTMRVERAALDTPRAALRAQRPRSLWIRTPVRYSVQTFRTYARTFTQSGALRAAPSVPPVFHERRCSALAPTDYDAWALVHGTTSAIEEAVALPTSGDDAARAVCDAVTRVLAAPRPETLSDVQAALALAYTTTLAPFHASAANQPPRHVPLALLGLAAEALVALGTAEALVLARKLLTFAQLHVGAVPSTHFRRMLALLGRRGDAAGVLQFERLAHVHATQADTQQSDAAALRLARLLAAADLGRDAELRSAWNALLAPVPYEAHAVRVAFYARRGNEQALCDALEALVADGHALRTATWLDLLSAHAPIRHVLTKARRAFCAHAPPAMLTHVLRALIDGGAAQHVPFVLRLCQVPGHGAIPSLSNEPLLRAARTVPPLMPEPAALALAATWCGRRGLAAPALTFLEETRAATGGGVAPDVRPNERRREHARDAAVGAMEHASAGTVQALVRAGHPQLAGMLARRLLGWVEPLHLPQQRAASDEALPALPINVPAPPDATDELATRIAAMPPCAPRSSLLTAALLDAAGALYSIDLARAALRDAAMHGLRVNGRVRRALARLLVRSVDAHRGEMMQLCAALLQPVTTVRRSPERTVVALRQRKLRDELAALGFDDQVHLAMLASDRRRAVAGARHAAEPEVSAHHWVRDTSLHPGDTPAAAASTAGPVHPSPGTTLDVPIEARTPVAYAQRLRLLDALGDEDAVQSVFRDMLSAGIAPRAPHVEPLVQTLCRGERVREASWLLRHALPAWNMAPTRPMYLALVQAYADAGDWRAVARELHEMQRSGVVPDAHLDDALAAAAVRQHALHDASPPPLARVARPEAVDVRRLASVAQHFQLLMHQRAYLGAQQFYAGCLARGMVPDYAMRCMLKRSVNWLAKHGNIASDTAPAATTAIAESAMQDDRAALALARQNVRASSHAAHPAARAHIAQKRAFRRALVCLVREVLSGRVGNGASTT